MAQVDFTLDHGQDPKAARGNFEHAITTAQTRFAKWVRQVNWSEDRTSVAMTGPGFDVVLRYDDQKVYVRGTVPVAFKLMEGPIRLFIAQASLTARDRLLGSPRLARA